VRAPALEALQAQHQLFAANISAAQTYDEIASALSTKTTAWPEPNTVVILVLEPDGALRLVGCAGLTLEARSQWTRIPPIVDLPIVVAAHARLPVWLPNQEAIAEHFPMIAEMYQAQSVIALPLHREDQVIGSLGLSWTTALELSDNARRYLYAVAEPCARRVSELSHSDMAAPLNSQADLPDYTAVAARELLPLLIEAISDPAVILSPVVEGQQVIDFTVEHGNSAALAAVQSESLKLVGSSVLGLIPEAGSQQLVPALTAVSQTGEPHELKNIAVLADNEGTKESYLLNMRAVRLWDRVLVVFRAGHHS
jgi:hypothetical protein